MRTFEMVYIGGFQLTEEMKSFKKIFPKIIIYRDANNLIEKIKYYLAAQGKR